MISKDSVISFQKRQYTKWSSAFPTIFTSLFLFFTLYYFFGISYVLFTPFLTQFFRIEHTKNWFYSHLLLKISLLYLLCIGTFIATRTLFLCILINFLVPFLFTLIFTTQFTPKAYMVYGMEWIFLQIRPITYAQLPIQLFALTYGICTVFLFLCIYRYLVLKPSKHSLFQNGFSILSELYLTINACSTPCFTPLQTYVSQLQHQLYTQKEPFFSYHNTKKINPHYHLYLFFEHILYIHQKFPNHIWIQTKEDELYFQKLSEITSHLSKTNSYHLGVIQLHNFLAEYHLSSPQKNDIYKENLLFLMKLLNNTRQEPEFPHLLQTFQTLIQTFEFTTWLTLEQFQLRFALRLSIILSCTFGFCFYHHMDHSYWIPLTIFFTLMPYSDESNLKIIHRIFGTLLGIIIITTLHFMFPTNQFLFLFIIIFTCCMYSIPPTSWQMTIYTTCYGMTLASLSLGLEKAIVLRLIYVFIGITITFLSSHFLFPNRLEKEFHKNMERLYQVNQTLLKLFYIRSNKKIQTISLFQKQRLYSNLIAKEIYHYQISHKNTDCQAISHLLEKQQHFTSELGYFFYIMTQKSQDKTLFTDVLSNDTSLYHILFESATLEECGSQLQMFLQHFNEEKEVTPIHFSTSLFQNLVSSLYELIQCYQTIKK